MTQAVPIDMIVFIVGAFLGALVSGVSGFAFGPIASAIWLHVITPAQSAVLIAAYAMGDPGCNPLIATRCKLPVLFLLSPGEPSVFPLAPPP